MRKQSLVEELIEFAQNVPQAMSAHEWAYTVIGIVRDSNELRPMKDAPRDGTEILAYHSQGKNLHQVCWRKQSGMAHWTNRWNTEYWQHDCDFIGWIHVPSISNVEDQP